MATYFPQTQGLQTQNPLRLAESYQQNVAQQQKMGLAQQEMSQRNAIQQQAQQTAERQHKLKIYQLGLKSGNADFFKELWKQEFPNEETPNFKFTGNDFETIIPTPSGKKMHVKGPIDAVKAHQQFAIENPRLNPQELAKDATDRGISLTEWTGAEGLEPGKETTEDRYVRDQEAKYRQKNSDMPKQEIAKQIAKKRPEWRLEHKRAQPKEAGAVSEARATGSEYTKLNFEQFNTATKAAGSIEDIDRLIEHIESSEAITGLGAEVFKNIERVKTLLGSKAAADKVSDTELLDVMMGSEVFPLIKALGIGARGMDTPAEREFMRKVLTGEISLNKETLTQMAEIRRKIAVRAVEKWNKRVGKQELDKFFKTTGMEPSKIYYPKRSKIKPGHEEEGWRFKGGDPADPNSWEQL